MGQNGKVDFLILYEHKARELENCALLKYELERRGYSVVVECIYSYSRLKYLPQVLIVPHLYDDIQVGLFVQSLKGKITKVISMQYEQVFSPEAEKHKVTFHRGEALNAYHLAWGDYQKEKYLEAGIKEEHIKKLCSLTLDFYKEPLSSYITSKEELANTHSLDASKKWITFMSSYAMVSFTKEQLENYYKRMPQYKQSYELQTQAQKILLDWIKEYCLHHDVEFIYRRHPAEYNNSLVSELAKEVKNFHVIFDDSARAWMKATDFCIVTDSTMIVDAFFSKTPHAIIEPIPMPDGLKARILIGTPSVTSKEKFFEVLSKDEQSEEYRLNADMVRWYYGDERINCVYPEIVDWFEEVYHFGQDYEYHPPQITQKQKTMLRIMEFGKSNHLSKLKLVPHKYIRRLEKAEKEMYNIDSALDKVQKRISKALEMKADKKI